MKRILLSAILMFTPVLNTGRVAQAAPPDLRSGETPIGSLGYPLGSYLTIEGQRERGEGIKMALVSWLTPSTARSSTSQLPSISIISNRRTASAA